MQIAGRSNPANEPFMEALVVFTREETIDSHARATYSAGVGPSFDGHGVTFLAAYGAIEHSEVRPLKGP